MQKILALDPGDQWTGTALSDALSLIAKPLSTVATATLESFLKEAIFTHSLRKIVIGYPLTLRGTESEQTKKAIALQERLQKKFPDINWLLWDERLSSKQANKLKHAKTKEQKLQAHSTAAAFILQSYLDYLYQQRSS